MNSGTIWLWVLQFPGFSCNERHTWIWRNIYLLHSNQTMYAFIMLWHSLMTVIWSGTSRIFFLSMHLNRLFTVRNTSWFEAEKFCRGFSVPCGDGGSSGRSLGHLASVHSQEEMDLMGALYDSVRSKWVRNISCRLQDPKKNHTELRNEFRIM